MFDLMNPLGTSTASLKSVFAYNMLWFKKSPNAETDPSERHLRIDDKTSLEKPKKIRAILESASNGIISRRTRGGCAEKQCC